MFPSLVNQLIFLYQPPSRSLFFLKGEPYLIISACFCFHYTTKSTLSRNTCMYTIHVVTIPQRRQIIDCPTSLGRKTSLHTLQFICHCSKSIARALPKDNQYSFVRLPSTTPPHRPSHLISSSTILHSDSHTFIIRPFPPEFLISCHCLILLSWTFEALQ